ncbi:hypothetical protein HW555_012023 [Spodoptera exigua]|uniref:Uncharacterized protein n=1 Tax=Spodoptera exigua TaxID=7107 RepID=A0A835G6G0_SPOEX|nr:hypothetical protein HW555_012023 [Spodoptera exigua]
MSATQPVYYLVLRDSNELSYKTTFLSKMEKLRFTFAVLAASDGKTNVICITSIETPDGCVYDVPDEQKNANKHTSIISLEVYAKIKNSLKKRHQTRKIWIPLTDQIRKIYLDAGENVQFNDLYLEEITEDIKSSNNNYKSESEHKNFVKIADKFLLEKFSGRTSNVNQWIEEFETECGRFEILQDESKIEILKHLLEKQCLDWYTGSLLEYATKKERLLLEVNKDIDTETMINLIVMGLPDYVMNKIDRALVTSTARLCNEIGKQEYTVTKKNFTKFTKNVPDNTSKYQKEIALKEESTNLVSAAQRAAVGPAVVGALHAVQVGVHPVQRARRRLQRQRRRVHQLQRGHGGAALACEAGALHGRGRSAPHRPEHEADGGIQREAVHLGQRALHQQAAVAQVARARIQRLAAAVHQVPVAGHPVHGQMLLYTRCLTHTRSARPDDTILAHLAVQTAVPASSYYR